MDFSGLLDLASEKLGGMVEYATDDFFAEKENLIKASEPVWKEGVYTDRGKWMDGWESRRKRVAGHDWAIIRLGLPGVIRGVVVDTTFFTGNYPASCSIEAASVEGCPSTAELLSEGVEWFEVVPKTGLKGDTKNVIEARCERRVTHLRLHIYPDGGVARLRVYGEGVPEWPRLLRSGGEVDLAAAEHGGRAVGANDAHYGAPVNLIMPGRGVNMGDGWETRRRRGPGHDWAILALAAPGTISTVEVDTNHFKGNYPDRCSIDVCYAPGADWMTLNGELVEWRPLLPEVKLQAHARHFFHREVASHGVVTHARLRIVPDGGVSRLRLLGRVAEEARERLVLRWLNTLSAPAFREVVRACCGSSAWCAGLEARRPFGSAAEVQAAAEEVWWGLGEAEWQEAFASHPRIGASKSAKQGAEANRWSAEEQRGVQGASEAVKARQAELNAAYEARFGYIYIVCATGRSAEEMASLAAARLEHDPQDEVRVAAAEQAKITALRLQRIVEP